MKNKAYCLGGSQHGVKVSASSDHFHSPNDEHYSWCSLFVDRPTGGRELREYWKLGTLSIHHASMLANQYNPR